jgi:hypothetical protein
MHRNYFVGLKVAQNYFPIFENKVKENLFKMVIQNQNNIPGVRFFCVRFNKGIYKGLIIKLSFDNKFN